MYFAVTWRHVKVAKLGVERTLETPYLESLTVRFQPKDMIFSKGEMLKWCAPRC